MAVNKWKDVCIYTLHRPSKGHLAVVTKKMLILGPPTLRAVWVEDHWEAVEGSHRLAAAQKLRLTPVIQEVTVNDVIKHDIPDLDSPAKVRSIIELLQFGPGYRFSKIVRG